MLGRIADYLGTQLHGKLVAVFSPVANWGETREGNLRERVAAVDFLSRYGKPDIAAENELVRGAAQMSVEDRARLAEILARRRQGAEARRLLEPTWALISVEGRRAVLAESIATPFYFESTMRPLARILTATLAVDPAHPLLGPLVETLLQQRSRLWNTQDLASSAQALVAFDLQQRPAAGRDLRVRYADRVLLQASGGARAPGGSNLTLSSVLSGKAASNMHLTLSAGRGEGALYYYLSLTEIPTAPPVTPEIQGIQVERWYEKLDGITPVTSVAEGELVRVRLRITVPATRYFVVVDDPLPAGLEAVDLSLRTASATPGPGVTVATENTDHEEREPTQWFGRWDAGWWSPFDYRELRDDRVIYSANVLWRGSYTATYIARATTPGTFIKPPVHTEEMYNPGLYGRSDGGTFVVTAKPAPK